MLRFGWTAISSFSALPLRISIAAGCFLSCAGFFYLLYVVYLAWFTSALIPGWASVVALECIFSGMILLALGGIGDYLARTYEEAKQRPLYVVTSTCNISLQRTPERAIVLDDIGAVELTGGFAGPRLVEDTSVLYEPLVQVRG
jgi:dolichol-phosphate mannosyltransferase